MLVNYLKIAFRALLRSKVHSSINILGLSLGIACCILIVLFVKDEWTFDTFHSKADRIYRAYCKEDWGENQEFFNTTTPFPLGPVLKENFPEVEATVRINNIGPQIKSGLQQFSDPVTVAGENFFDVFDFEMIKGEKETALRSLGNIVLTETTAEKYFGSDDPINKVISIQLGENSEDFFVKAIVANPPINSSIQFSMLISDLNYPRLYSQQSLTSAWFNITPETYVLLKEGADKEALEQKLPALFRTILGEQRYNESKYKVGLQPLTSIHLDTSYPAGMAPVSDPKYAYILAAVALLILFVACINFVTLSVGRSLKRAKEVGIRKVVGAERTQLIMQFIGEAMIVTLFSMVAGIVLAYFCLPFFNTLAGKSLVLAPDAFTFGLALVLLTIIGLFAGSYPSFVLSNFRPVSVLKGSVQGISNRQAIRRILVSVQLILSIFLITSTLIMRNQLDYLMNKNLGYNKEQLAVVQLNVQRTGRLAERIVAGFGKVQQFKNELTRLPDVAGVCGSSHDFSGSWTNVGYTDENGTYRTFNMNTVEPDFFKVLQMEFVQGRNFDIENASDARRGVVINEAFAKELGWTDPIGKRIPGKNFPEHEVIAVVKDFNYASLYTSVAPLAMVMEPSIILKGIENININNTPIPKLFIRLKPGNMSNAIDQVKVVWDKLTGGEEFAFSFVDQTLAAQYRSDQNLGKIITVATVLAVIIGSLGLYGLASLAMQNRTKEISIRKVLGATERSLLVMLSRDYVLLVVISLIVSAPFTWYMMDSWLAGFEYRVPITPSNFALAGIISLSVALLTISYHAMKTAWTQPATALKCE